MENIFDSLFIDLNKFQFKFDKTFTTVRRYRLWCSQVGIIMNLTDETPEWVLLLPLDSCSFTIWLVWKIKWRLQSFVIQPNQNDKSWRINLKKNFKNDTETDVKKTRKSLLLLLLAVSFEVYFLIFLFLWFPHQLQKVCFCWSSWAFRASNL